MDTMKNTVETISTKHFTVKVYLNPNNNRVLHEQVFYKNGKPVDVENLSLDLENEIYEALSKYNA